MVRASTVRLACQLVLGPLLLACSDTGEEPPSGRGKPPDSAVEAMLDVPLRCDDLGANQGWREAVCEKGGNRACQGQGPGTSDCERCCEAPAPATCAQIAAQRGWAGAACETSEDWACGGLGEASSDCDACCEAPTTPPTCAQVAAEWGYTQAVCETQGNEACGGVGMATSDCDVCCDVSAAEDPQLADDEGTPAGDLDEDMALSESLSPTPGSETPGGEAGASGSEPGGEGEFIDAACGAVGTARGWANAVCEYGGNGACEGQGPRTTDCDHCCAGAGGTTPGACGDGVCSGSETCSSCSADCGACLRVAQVNLSGVDSKDKLHRVARQLQAQKPDLVGVQSATKEQASYLDKQLAMTDTRFAWVGEQGGKKVGHALLSTYELDGFEVKPLPGQRLLLTADVMAPQGMFTFATTQLDGDSALAATAVLQHLSDEHALLTASLGAAPGSKAYKVLNGAMPDGWSSGWGEGTTTQQREDYVFWGQAWKKPVGGQAVGDSDGTIHRPVVQKNRKPRTKKTLKVEAHPRLLVRAKELKQVQETLKLPAFEGWNSQNAAFVQKLIQTDTNGSYTEPLLKVEGANKDDAAGWAAVRRPNVCWPFRDRILALGMAYRLDPRPEYAVRAIREMLAVARMEHWVADPYKAQFLPKGKAEKYQRYELDTGEILMVMGLGYDWFQGAISQQDRRTILRAILNKGIKPGLKAHRQRYWWLGREPFYNWTHVCTGGAIVGALAALDASADLAGEKSDPELKELIAEVEDSSAELLERSVQALKPAMKTFGPDGAWMEGPGYWSYAAFMATLGIESMRTALTRDHDRPHRGLTTLGFRRSGDFLAHVVGPTGSKFNYADSGPGIDIFSSGPLFWISRWSKKPVYADVGRNLMNARGADLLDVLWYNPDGAQGGLASLPPAASFGNVSMVSMRSAWNDPGALWVAFKGGKNGENHGDLDLGTFVLEAGGQRFGVDHGPSDYGLPGYFQHPKRFSYYTKRTAGQSTLSFSPDGKDATDMWTRREQDMKARAPIADKKLGGEQPFATLDLSAAYAEYADKVRRKFEMDRTGTPRVTITDKISGSKAGTWSWEMQLNPGATHELLEGGKVVRLTLGGVVLEGRIAAGTGVFEVSSVQLTKMGRLPPQNSPAVETEYVMVPYLLVRTDVKGGKDADLKVTFQRVSP